MCLVDKILGLYLKSQSFPLTQKCWNWASKHLRSTARIFPCYCNLYNWEFDQCIWKQNDLWLCLFYFSEDVKKLFLLWNMVFGVMDIYVPGQRIFIFDPRTIPYPLQCKDHYWILLLVVNCFFLLWHRSEYEKFRIHMPITQCNILIVVKISINFISINDVI